jgi:regulator of replication initiation timing
MQTQSTLLAKSVPSQKTSKVVTDKISTLETRVARLEGELQDVRGSLVDTKKSQQKTAEENNKLTKSNETLSDEIGELREELEGQGKMLESIQKILDGLKVDGGNLDKVVVKIEASTRNNAFNVSDSLDVVASKKTHAISPCRLVLVKPSCASWGLRAPSISKMLCPLVTTITTSRTRKPARTCCDLSGKLTITRIVPGMLTPSTSCAKKGPAFIQH